MLVVAIISTLSVFALKETADLDLDVPSERFAAAAPAVRGGVGD